MTPDPIAFNAQLAAVEAAMNEPVSAELAAAYERIAELERVAAYARNHLINPQNTDVTDLFRELNAALNDEVFL